MIHLGILILWPAIPIRLKVTPFREFGRGEWSDRRYQKLDLHFGFSERINRTRSTQGRMGPGKKEPLNSFDGWVVEYRNSGIGLMVTLGWIPGWMGVDLDNLRTEFPLRNIRVPITWTHFNSITLDLPIKRRSKRPSDRKLLGLRDSGPGIGRGSPQFSHH